MRSDQVLAAVKLLEHHDLLPCQVRSIQRKSHLYMAGKVFVGLEGLTGSNTLAILIQQRLTGRIKPQMAFHGIGLARNDIGAVHLVGDRRFLQRK